MIAKLFVFDIICVAEFLKRIGSYCVSRKNYEFLRCVVLFHRSVAVMSSKRNTLRQKIMLVKLFFNQLCNYVICLIFRAFYFQELCSDSVFFCIKSFWIMILWFCEYPDNVLSSPVAIAVAFIWTHETLLRDLTLKIVRSWEYKCNPKNWKTYDDILYDKRMRIQLFE